MPAAEYVGPLVAADHGFGGGRRAVGIGPHGMSGTPKGQIISIGLLELPGRNDMYRVAEVTVLPPEQAAAAEKRLEGEI